MKQFFRDYFTFNKRERNGVFILISIIAILVLYLNISSHFIISKPTDFTKFEADVKQFDSSLEETEQPKIVAEEKIKSGETVHKTESANAERFNFNPNNLPENDWKRLVLNLPPFDS